MSYLQSYLDRIRSRGNPALADAINKTVQDVVPQYISNFSFTDHVVSLLVGDVQSGKTSHMFGLMCAAADESFMNFVLLTTDNILLQQQTYQRALRDLPDFCVYWKPKIERNIQRDAENQRKLEADGWKVIVVWECELKKRIAEERLSRLCEEIKADILKKPNTESISDDFQQV